MAEGPVAAREQEREQGHGAESPCQSLPCPRHPLALQSSLQVGRDC